MLWILLVLVTMVVLWWGIVRIMPGQRHAGRFLYQRADLPSRLNATFPKDDVIGEWGGDPAEWPSVLIILPGRNEGHLLEKTLGSLCAMDYPRYEVLFIDDQSTDDTAAVCTRLAAKHPNLRVLHNVTSPPDGWVGKVWAVHQAEEMMKASRAEYFLFTDADLVFDSACLKQMVRLAQHRRADITSLLPALEYESFGELLGLIPALVLINMTRSLYVSNNPRSPKALVAGGFLLAKRTAYEALGGHAAVRGQMIEDIALGALAKSRGLRVFTVGTHDLVRARMYEGFRDTYRGLKKNAYAGANYNPLLIVPATAIILLLGAMVPLYPLIGAWLWITRPSLLTFSILVLSVIGFTLMHLVGSKAANILGLKRHTAWALAPGFLFYVTIFIGSVKDYYRGGNTWSGRRIASSQLQNLSEAETKR